MQAIKNSRCFDCYYIHDISTTTITNRELSRYCSRNHVDMNIIPQNIRQHIATKPSDSMEIVALQCYECDRVGNVNQATKHLVTVIGQTYSHYVLDEERGDVAKRTDDEDSFDFRRKTFKTSQFRKESYFTEQDSNKRVLELFDIGFTVKGNMHRFINEFCYDLYEGHDEKDFKGRLIEKPEGLSFPLLSSSNHYIAEETVVFGNAKCLRVVNDSLIKDYSYEHKTLAFDIETVLVDEFGEKIDDQIIQVSLVYQEGKRIHRIIGITIGTVDVDPGFYNFSHMTEFCSNDRLPDVEIYCVRDERELIDKIIEVCVDVKPDYLLGYNCISFDIPVLLKSADRHKIDFYGAISHLTGFHQNRASLEKDLLAYRNRKQEEDLSTLEDNKCFDLSYKLFPGVLINDLFRVHSGEKLDTLAKTHLGFGKEDVNYVEIPRMFYSRDVSDRSKLLKYNIVDSLLCSLLLNTDDNFLAYKFFTMCMSLFKIPHSQFFNNQKMSMIVPILYNAFRKENMLQDVRLKPSRENNRRSIAQILRYFLYDDQDVTLSTAKEWLFKFSTGTVKTKTIVKHFDLNKRYGDQDRVDFDGALQILDEQLRQARLQNSKNGRQYYTLTHFMLLVRFLGEPKELVGFDARGFVSDYMRSHRLGRHAPVNVQKRAKKSDNVLEQEEQLMSELITFLKYLSRRFITTSHTIENLVSDYISSEQLDTKYKQQVEDFGIYLNDNSRGKLGDKCLQFIRFLSLRCMRRRRFVDKYTCETFCQEVFNRISNHFLEKFYEPFKYDGAYIYLPNPGVIADKPVNCDDFTSLYPNIGVQRNCGKHVQVSKRTILDNKLKVNEDYTVNNIFTRDDFREVDLQALSDDEARECFRFYLTQKHSTSIYAKTWASIIALRLYFKRQIGKFDNDKDNQIVEEKSNTFKIVINSIYGVLSLLGEWQVSAVITGAGRQYIQSVGKYLAKHRNASLVYGDTDSVMYHLNMTTAELSESFNRGELLRKGWIREEDCSYLQQFANDDYKQGCMVSSVISKRAVEELNDLYKTNPETAIYKPPSKLEHEKTMLPFVIFKQKKYFAKIVDTNKENCFIIRGLEARKRTRVLATERIENMMCSELLQRRSSSWKTFQLASQIVSSLLNETVDLNTISSRQKVTVTTNRLKSTKSDAGIELFKRMVHRGEIVDTGGLDKISVDVIKVINKENKSKVKLESLEYLEKLRRDNRPLELDSRSIVSQILKEVVTIMSVVHPSKTCQYYLNLLNLKLSPEANPSDFEVFASPGTRNDNATETSRVSKAKKAVMNNSIYTFFNVVDNKKSTPKPTKRLSTFASDQPTKKLKQTSLDINPLKRPSTSVSDQPAKKLKQTVINFGIKGSKSS